MQSKSIDCNSLRRMRANVCAMFADDEVDQLVEEFANSRVANEHDAIVTLWHVGGCHETLLDVAVQTRKHDKHYVKLMCAKQMTLLKN